MRKMLTLLITLFAIYFGIQFVYNFFSKGHDINYTIESNEGTISVHEVLTTNGEEEDNYFFDVTYNNVSIPFKIYDTYSRKEKIIREVVFYNDDQYTCASIKVNGEKEANDIKCVKDNVVYYYSSIIGQDASLDNLIAESDYNASSFMTNDNDSFKKDESITIYPKNLPEDQTLLMNSYRGIYLIGNDVTAKARFIEFYNQDLYENSLQYQFGKYYVSVDYNSPHEFDAFNVVNISNGNNYTITSIYDISYNSFIQGAYDNQLYLIDRDTKKQYRIDVKKKKVELIGSEADGAQVLSNGKFVSGNINEIINNNLTFTDTTNLTVNGDIYDKVILLGDENNGTYYCFENKGSGYNVYAIYTKNYIKNYLFTTSDIERVVINNDFVYYIDDNNIMAFAPTYGYKKILTNNELKYNNKLFYYVY